MQTLNPRWFHGDFYSGFPRIYTCSWYYIAF